VSGPLTGLNRGVCDVVGVPPDRALTSHAAMPAHLGNILGINRL
jgi:hypothetical protein